MPKLKHTTLNKWLIVHDVGPALNQYRFICIITVNSKLMLFYVHLNYHCCVIQDNTIKVSSYWYIQGPFLVQVTLYRRLLIGRDGHLDQSEAYDIS